MIYGMYLCYEDRGGGVAVGLVVLLPCLNTWTVDNIEMSFSVKERYYELRWGRSSGL